MVNMDSLRPKIWILSDNEEFCGYIQGITAAFSNDCRKFDNVSEILNLDEPDQGVMLLIDSTKKFSNYMPLIKRFQRNFVSFDIVVFGEPKQKDELESEFLDGVDYYVDPGTESDEISSHLNWLSRLRSVKSAHGIIGRSREINRIIEKIQQVAPTEVSILIEGESGTGKEVMARAAHRMSGRKDKAFEAINCGALAEGVLESELFGHEKGSFTGAVGRRRGLFERADGGTVFLDEVGEMPPGMQVKLLRVIESGDFLRVGGIEKIHSNVRIIAATNKDLAIEVESGDFRRDLYYRLKVVQIKIPPLRMRREDIILFANVFLKRAADKHGKKIRGMGREGFKLLEQYPWPGNVRELLNVIDNMVVLSDSSFISADDINARLIDEREKKSFPDLPVHIERSREDMERELIMNSLLSLNNDVREILRLLRDMSEEQNMNLNRWIEINEEKEDRCRDMDSIEKDAIQEALSMNNGNRRKAAEQLGISERTLYRRLKKYDL